MFCPGHGKKKPTPRRENCGWMISLRMMKGGKDGPVSIPAKLKK
jgi:hypothetical protein